MFARRCARSVLIVLVVTAAGPAQEKAGFLLREKDRVAWVGSSSTNIGVWPRTMEFLLRTRHPELGLEFHRFSTGGGTFATGLQNLDKWLESFRPTVVLFNYGGNDAGAGEAGLPAFRKNIELCVARVEATGARVILMTHQAADARKSGAEPAARRRRYAEELLAFARDRGWHAVDVFHPLDQLQQAAQKDDPDYTILKDRIHLTDAAYVAWGFFLYERLGPGEVESLASLSADGQVRAARRCTLRDVQVGRDSLAFTRADAVLPILPPAPLPPRRHVPLEKLSLYRLQVSGLPKGRYQVRCEGQPIGTATAADLGRGINLNSLVLAGGQPAPWQTLAREIWAGKSLDQLGRTAWRFEVRKE